MQHIDLIITTLIILLGIYLFIKEHFRIDTTSVIIMACFIVSGVLTPAEGFSGFNNPATITVACMFVISAGVFKTNVLDGVGNLLVYAGKFHQTGILIGIMLLSGMLSAFISDTAVVAMLMPVVIQVAHQSKIPPGKLLMPLSFGALLGGVCTLVGTSTNILVSGIAEQHGIEPLGMFEFTQAAIWLLAGGMIYMLTIGNWLMPGRRSEEEPLEKSTLKEYVTEILISDEAVDINNNIGFTKIEKVYEAQIIGLHRNYYYSRIENESLKIQAGDILRITISPENLLRLRKEKGVQIPFEQKRTNGDAKKKPEKLFELTIPSGSPFAKKSLRQLYFRQTYGAVVMGVHSKIKNRHDDIANMILQEGNVLLVLCDESMVQRIRNDGNLVLVSDYAPKKINVRNAIISILITAGVIISSAIGIAPIVIAAMVGCLLMITLRILKPEDAYQSVDWKVIFMIASVLSMGVALEKTGGAMLLGKSIQYVLGNLGPQAALSFIIFTTFMATNVITNNATAALMTPIAISLAYEMGLSERPFLIAVAFAASCSFMTPMSYQTNTMIYAPGNYRFNDYLKVGTPLNILIWLIASIVIPMYFPFYK